MKTFGIRPIKAFGFCAILAYQTLMLPGAQASSIENAMGRRAFLFDNSTRVTANYDINNVHIKYLQSCLENMTDEQFLAAVPGRTEKPEPWKNCADGITQVRENTRLEYPVMRKNLLLSQMLGGGVDLLLAHYASDMYSQSKGQTISGTHIFATSQGMFSRDLVTSNPLSTWLSPEELPSPNWQRDEILAALDGLKANTKDSFNFLFKDAFDRFTKESANSTFSFMKLQFHFQAITRLRYDEQNGTVAFNFEGRPEELSKTYTEANVARDFWKDLLREDQKRIEGEFLAQVQANPYIALVTSATPGRAELIAAFKIMSARAQTSVDQHAQFRKIYHLDDLEHAKYMPLVSLMANTPVARSLIDRPGPELQRVLTYMPTSADPQALFDELMSEYNSFELKRAGIEVGAVIAANVFLCWIPVSRAGRVAVKLTGRLIQIERISQLFTAAGSAETMKAAFSPICYSLAGAATNVGFLYANVSEYGDVYRQVFGSVEEEELMRDVNALSEKDREIFWSLVTAPIGTGIFKGAKALMGRLTGRVLKKAEAIAGPLP